MRGIILIIFAILCCGTAKAQSNYENWDFLNKSYKYASFEAEGRTHWKTGHILINADYRPTSHEPSITFTLISDGKIRYYADAVIVASFDFKWQLAHLYAMNGECIDTYLSVNMQEETITFGAPGKDASTYNIIID